MASSQTSSKYVGGCPYVGMYSDPQTHVGTPDVRNCCHLLQPPLQIKTAHQNHFCLGGGFPDCPVYKTSGEAPVSMDPFEEEEIGSRGLAGLFSPFRRASRSSQTKAESESDLTFEPEPDTTTGYTDDYPSFPIGAGVQKSESGKRSRVWLVIAALIVVGAVSFGAWWGIGRIKANAQSAVFQDAQTPNSSVANALQEISTAEHVLKTAEGVLGTYPSATSPANHLTSLVTATDKVATSTPIPPTKDVTILPTSTPIPTVCDSIDQTRIEIVSGPQISPGIGTLYLPGSPKPQAVWVLKNASDCSWTEIFLWSVKENKIVQPLISKAGVPLSPGLSDANGRINPGEQIEIALEFNPYNTIKIDNEWVMVINGLSLFGQPRLELQIDNWLIFPQAATPSPTLKQRTPRPGGDPTDETPPPRP